MTVLSHTSEIGFNPFQNLIRFTLAVFLNKPFMRQSVTFAQIATTTQTNHIRRNCAGAVGITQRYPMVSMWHYISKQITQLTTAYSAAVMKVFKALIPLVYRECARQAILLCAAALFQCTTFVRIILRVCFCSLSFAFNIFIVMDTPSFVVQIPTLVSCLLIPLTIILFCTFAINLTPFLRYLATTLLAIRIQSVTGTFSYIKIFNGCRKWILTLCTNLRGYGIIGHSSNSLAVGEPLGASNTVNGFIVSPYYSRNLGTTQAMGGV